MTDVAAKKLDHTVTQLTTVLGIIGLMREAPTHKHVETVITMLENIISDIKTDEHGRYRTRWEEP